MGIHDLSIALLIPVFLVLLSRGANLKHLASLPFLLFSLYVGLILLVPLIGIAFIPQASISMYFGDLRWLYIIAMVVSATVVYQRLGLELFERHLQFFLIVAISVVWLVLLPQIYMQVSGASPPRIVRFWYPEGRSGPSFGFHIFRFAGPFGAISALSTFGVVLYGAGLFSRNRGLSNLYIFVSGLMFALASGGRTGFIAIFILTFAFVLVSLFRRRISVRGTFFFLLMAISVFVLLSVAVNLNLGRLESGRIQSTFQFIGGETTLYEVGGRGGQRWSEPLEESQRWSRFGTLVNSSNALDLPAFDSYYIFLLAQAGWIIIIPFLMAVGFSFLTLWRSNVGNPSLGNSFALAVVIILPIFGITQNTMTGLLGRVLLGIAMMILLLNQIKAFRGALNHSVPAGIAQTKRA